MTLDREQALDTALGQIERQFGKGSVMRMSDQAQVSIGAVSTGSLALDLALGIVAVDSVAALTPKAEIEGEMGDAHVGLQARLMSQALRKLAGTLNRTD